MTVVLTLVLMKARVAICDLLLNYCCVVYPLRKLLGALSLIILIIL